ncbi:MAG: ACP S-malonyltransferase [Microbacteriaceae bacterium]|nr:ACP S-malonyltransferase [Microbacteriaceae bacterium]
MIIVVCPGQGSQTPGFMEPWIADARSRALLESLSEAAEIDLITHGTISDADTIRDTQIAQPLIVAAGVLTLDALSETDHLAKTGGTAGHSVGEFTAAVGAGVLDAHDATKLVALRGRAMADAATRVSTGMSAIIGGDEDEVTQRLVELGLFAANYNGGGQLVAAGDLTALTTLAENPPAGTRVIPLHVAGAFHTPYMESAVSVLREAADTVNHADPVRALWTNRDGSRVTSGRAYLDLMVGQVSSPVRWDLCMEAFADAGVTGIIEVAPAGALVGLAKRALKGIPTVAIKSPDDLAVARDLIDSLT